MKENFLLMLPLVPEEEFNKLMVVDKNPQMATHLFYWKFLRAIISSKSGDSRLYVISMRPMTEYPNCQVKFVKGRKWNVNGTTLHETFLINYPVIKILSVFFSCLFKGMKWGINRKRKRAIIVDSTAPFLMTGYILSRIYKVPLITVITDPPNMHYKISWETTFKSKFRRINSELLKYLFQKISGVIALTSGLVNEFCPGKESIIIEGITEPEVEIIQENFVFEGKFVILYSGSLSKMYGILDLITAVRSLPYTNVELWLFGKGDVEDLIKEHQAEDRRIRHFGYLVNSDIIKYQRTASLLVNPRPTNLPDANYSFPSKILEYMQSGTPTLLTRLPGIPTEYDSFVFYTDGFGADALKKKIQELYLMDPEYLRNIGWKAKKFAESKNVINQGRKIADFMKSVAQKFNIK